MPTVIRRTDQVSKTMQSVISKSIAQYHQVHKQVKQAAPQETEITSNQISLPIAIASGRFAYKGFDLYKEADTDSEFGRVWVKKEILDEKTGEKKEWLVVYTSDDQEIVRQLANEALGDLHKKAWHNTGTKVQYYDNNRELQSGTVVGMIAGRIRIENVNGITDEVDESQIVDENPNLGNNVDVFANKTAAASPNPKDIPIAQGIKSKNITIDETGGGGTAKVTVEFTDVQKGLSFYQNDVSGEAPAKEPATAEEPKDVEENPEKTPENEGAPTSAQPQPGVGQAQVAPGPMPVGLPGQASVRSNTLKKESILHDDVDNFPWNSNVEDNTSSTDAFGQILMVGDSVREDGGDRRGVIEELNNDIAKVNWEDVGDELIGDSFYTPENVSAIPTSKLVKWASPTVRKMSRGGAQVVDIIKEDIVNHPMVTATQYSFVNEAGQKVVLNPDVRDLKKGDQLQRPDTKQTARVGNIIERVFSSKDSIVSELIKEALPIRRDDMLGFKLTGPEFIKFKQWLIDNIVSGRNSFIKQLVNETIEYSPNSTPESIKDEIINARNVYEMATGLSFGTQEIQQLLNEFIVTNGKIASETTADMDKEVPGTVEDAEDKDKLMWTPPWLDKEDGDKKKDDTDEKETKDDKKEDKEATLGAIAAELVKEAIDISDQISPMGWTTESEDNAPVGAGPNLPPNPELNNDQNNPNDPSKANVVYDTSKGQSPSFQTTIDPNDQSVKIKFIPNEQQQQLDQTVQNQGQQPAAQPTPAPPQQQPVNPVQNNQPNFEDMNIPNNF
jgi:hypothetical protein